MATFLSDTFTDTTGTNLDVHTPGTGGAWSTLDVRIGNTTTSTTVAEVSSTGLLVSATTSRSRGYRNAAVPDSAEYDITAVWSIANNTSTNYTWTMGGRLTDTGVDNLVNRYAVNYIGHGTAGTRTWELVKVVSGTLTVLSSAAEDITGTHNVVFEIRNATKRLVVDGSQRCLTTDNAITQTGRVGIGAPGNAVVGNGIDSIVASTLGSYALGVVDATVGITVDTVAVTTSQALVFTDGTGLVDSSSLVASNYSLTVADATSALLFEYVTVTPSSAVISDYFDRVDAATLGANWTSSRYVQVVNQQVAPVTTFSSISRHVTAPVAVQRAGTYVEVDYVAKPAADSGFCGPALYIPAVVNDAGLDTVGDFYALWLTNSTLNSISIRKHNSLTSTFTSMKVESITSVTLPARMRLEDTGTDLVGYVDGVERVRVAKGVAPLADGGLGAGLHIDPGTDLGYRFDNFEAGFSLPVTTDATGLSDSVVFQKDASLTLTDNAVLTDSIGIVGANYSLTVDDATSALLFEYVTVTPSSAVISDYFDRVDAATLGANWTSSRAVQIVDRQAAPTTILGGVSRYGTNAWTTQGAGAYVELDYVARAALESAFCGPAIYVPAVVNEAGLDGVGDFYVLWLINSGLTAITIRKHNSLTSTFTSMGSEAVPSVTLPVRMRLEDAGADLVGYLNGVEVIRVAKSVAPLADGGLGAGMYIDTGTNYLDYRFDNFEAGFSLVSPTDVAGLTDSIVVQSGGLTKTDTAGLTDNITTVSQTLRTITDGVGLVDYATNNFAAPAFTVTDGVGLKDTVTLSGAHTDSTGLRDSVTLVSPQFGSQGGPLLIDDATLMSLPTTGAAWNKVVTWANTTPWPGTVGVNDQDNDYQLYVLAGALYGKRMNDAAVVARVVTALRAIIGTEEAGNAPLDTRTLSVGRTFPAYCIAADIIDMDNSLTGTRVGWETVTFGTWVAGLPTTFLPYAANTDTDTLIKASERQATNHGTVAMAARTCAQKYSGNMSSTVGLPKVSDVLARYLGDRTKHVHWLRPTIPSATWNGSWVRLEASFGAEDNYPATYGEVGQTEAVKYANYVGINPRNNIGGLFYDGIQVSDIPRESMIYNGNYGGFSEDGISYSYMSVQSLWLVALVLEKTGYTNVWSWSDSALLRAMKWFDRAGQVPNVGQTAHGSWVPWVANAKYSSAEQTALYPTQSSLIPTIPVEPFRLLGFTDWMFPAPTAVGALTFTDQARITDETTRYKPQIGVTDSVGLDDTTSISGVEMVVTDYFVLSDSESFVVGKVLTDEAKPVDSVTLSGLPPVTVFTDSATLRDSVTIVSPQFGSQGGPLLIDTATLMALPTSGSAWDKVVLDANTSPWPGTVGINNQDNDNQLYVLAGALYAKRMNDAAMKARVVTALRGIIGTESLPPGANHYTLSVGRTFPAYCIAADIIDMDNSLTGTLAGYESVTFGSWVAALPTVFLQGAANTDQDTLVKASERSATNHGTVAFAARTCAQRYVNDMSATGFPKNAALLARHLGNRTQHNQWLRPAIGPSWQESYVRLDASFGATSAEQTEAVKYANYVSVNSRNSIGGLQWDGIQVCDICRESTIYDGNYGGFSSSGVSYSYMSVQAFWLVALILEKAGYTDVWSWSDSALLRTMKWLDRAGEVPATTTPKQGSWIPWVANAKYSRETQATMYPAQAETIPTIPVQPWRHLGYTDWMFPASTPGNTRAFTDSGGVTDSVSFAITRVITDSVQLTDAAQGQRLDFHDLTGLADTASVEILSGSTFVDVTGLTDTFTATEFLGVTVLDLTGMVDTTSRLLVGDTSKLDLVGLTDTVVVQLANGISIIDLVGPTDQSSTVGVFQRVIVDVAFGKDTNTRRAAGRIHPPRGYWGVEI